MEFFRGKTLIFKEFFRGEQRFHGIFREKSTFSRISSGVDPFLREVFRGECSLVEFFRGKKKSYSSTGGVRILNAIAQYMLQGLMTTRKNIRFFHMSLCICHHVPAMLLCCVICISDIKHQHNSFFYIYRHIHVHLHNQCMLLV